MPDRIQVEAGVWFTEDTLRREIAKAELLLGRVSGSRIDANTSRQELEEWVARCAAALQRLARLT